MYIFTTIKRLYGEWLTFRQCVAAGGKVRKGEKASMVVFWKYIAVDDEGCAVHWKTGEYTYPSREVLEKHLDQVYYIDDTLEGITVTAAKKLLRKYGGSAWTEHIDRGGGCFEVTPIQLTGNNSRFKYNVHL